MDPVARETVDFSSETHSVVLIQHHGQKTERPIGTAIRKVDRTKVSRAPRSQLRMGMHVRVWRDCRSLARLSIERPDIVMRMSSCRSDAWVETHSRGTGWRTTCTYEHGISHLDWNARALPRSKQPEFQVLRWQRDSGLRPMERRFQCVPIGYGSQARTGIYLGSNRKRQGLRARELPMGGLLAAGSQQIEQSCLWRVLNHQCGGGGGRYSVCHCEVSPSERMVS